MRHASGERDGALAGTRLPAIGCDHAVARIEPEQNPVREGGTRFSQKRGLTHGARTDDHLIDAGREVTADGFDFTDAAADLHRYAAGSGADRTDDRGVARFTRHRAIEVDQVQPLAALREPVFRHRHGIATEHRHVVHAALPQSDALTVFDVDRGDDDHRRARACPWSTA